MEITTVEMRTITPIWTGNHLGRSVQLMPQSLLGSLRFWFGVYCMATGMTTNFGTQERLNSDYSQKLLISLKNERLVHEDLYLRPIQNDDQMSLPAKLFGCSGWKSLIQIQEISTINQQAGDNLVQLLFSIRNKKHNNKKTELNGCYRITFRLGHTRLKKDILWPLLTFIQKYGYIGALNGDGFGRVEFFYLQENGEYRRVEEENFDFSLLSHYSKKRLDDAVCKRIADQTELFEPRDKLMIWHNSSDSKFTTIRALIERMRDERKKLWASCSKEQRVRLTGSRDEGAKILPLISRDDDGGHYTGGWLSLMMLGANEGGKRL